MKTGTLKNIFLHILKSKWTWLVLCFTGLVTVYVCASFSFAKYVERQTSDTSTDVATFIIEDDLSEKSYNLAISGSSSGSGLASKINVYNKSSVAVNYSVTVENVTKNLPIEFSDVSTQRIEAGAQTVFEVGITFTQSELPISYSGMIDIIRVTVVCVQAE